MAFGDSTKKEEKIDLNTLSVEIRDPDTVLYSGPAVAVSSKNSVGPLDILPQHENFISLLNDKIIVRMDKSQKKEIPNDSAIVKAKSNRVTIFLGVETLTHPAAQAPGLKPVLDKKKTEGVNPVIAPKPAAASTAPQPGK